jgi:hypothetical protein
MMIYMEPGNRRADTLNTVAEGRVQQHSKTGEYRFVGGDPGSWNALALKNLLEFDQCGLIETERAEYDGWAKVSVTAAGMYLFGQWKQGPPRAIVELPRTASIADFPPKASLQMLVDVDWSVSNIWRVEDNWVVEIGRVKDEAWEEKVLLPDACGLAYKTLSRADAAALAAAILAAAR